MPYIFCFCFSHIFFKNFLWALSWSMSGLFLRILFFSYFTFVYNFWEYMSSVCLSGLLDCKFFEMMTAGENCKSSWYSVIILWFIFVMFICIKSLFHQNKRNLYNKYILRRSMAKFICEICKEKKAFIKRPKNHQPICQECFF